jgi:hypothetical protein
MLKKQQHKEKLEQLSEAFLFEDLMLLNKIEKAENQSKNGIVISERNLEKEMEKWFK